MNHRLKSVPFIDFSTGYFSGREPIKKITTLADLCGVFSDEKTYSMLSPQQEIYQVEMFAASEVEGELLMGVTHLRAGCVGNEFFMTRGHFHQRSEQAEYYFGLCAQGLLLLQSQQGKFWYERVSRGSIHHIPGFTAHSLVNIGESTLSTMAVWPAIAGHHYESLKEKGFAYRIVNQGGKMEVVPQ